MRLFLAINLPADVREHLHNLQEALRTNVRTPASWTRAEQFHITVKFLGEMDQSQCEQLQAALSATSLPSLGSLSAEALQIFPPRGPARIVGAKMSSSGNDALQSAHKHIEDICAAMDIARENRPFRPHVTIARLRAPRRIPDAVHAAVAEHFPGPIFSVASLDLMQSTLDSTGVSYQQLAEFV